MDDKGVAVPKIIDRVTNRVNGSAVVEHRIVAIRERNTIVFVYTSLGGNHNRQRVATDGQGTGHQRDVEVALQFSALPIFLDGDGVRGVAESAGVSIGIGTGGRVGQSGQGVARQEVGFVAAQGLCVAAIGQCAGFTRDGEWTFRHREVALHPTDNVVGVLIGRILYKCDGVGFTTHISSFCAGADAAYFALQESVTAHGHHVLRQGGAIVSLRCTGCGQRDFARLDAEGVDNRRLKRIGICCGRGHIALLYELHRSGVVQDPACIGNGRASHHHLHCIASDKLSGHHEIRVGKGFSIVFSGSPIGADDNAGSHNQTASHCSNIVVARQSIVF